MGAATLPHFNKAYYPYICASHKGILHRTIGWIQSTIRFWCTWVILSCTVMCCYTGGNVKKMPHEGQGAGVQKVALWGIQKIPSEYTLFFC